MPPSSSEDYAIIVLDLPAGSTSSEGFGYNVISPDSEVTDRLVSIMGYPGEKPQGTMWTSGGTISKVDTSKLYYRIDTTGGQSGSPIYTWWSGYWTLVGIHTIGDCASKASRANSGKHLTLLVLDDILNSACYPWLNTTVQSVNFPNRFLRMDGPNNTVNAQYTALDYEHFRIMPVLVPPSLAADEAYDNAYVIESACFRGRYLRMDGQGVNKRTGPGGGTVDTQKGIGTFEMFRLVHQPTGSNVYSIGSMHFNNVYL